MAGKSNPDMLNRVGKMAKPFVYLRIVTLSIISIVLVCVIIYFAFFFRKNYIVGKAQVLNHKCKTGFDRKGNTSVHCIYDIKFKTKNGKVYSKSIPSSGSISSSENTKNQEVINITYNPLHPEETVTTVFNKWITLGICGFILLMVLISLAFNIIYRNNTLVGMVDVYRAL